MCADPSLYQSTTFQLGALKQPRLGRSFMLVSCSSRLVRLRGATGTCLGTSWLAAQQVTLRKLVLTSVFLTKEGWSAHGVGTLVVEFETGAFRHGPRSCQKIAREVALWEERRLLCCSCILWLVFSSMSNWEGLAAAGATSVGGSRCWWTRLCEARTVTLLCCQLVKVSVHLSHER